VVQRLAYSRNVRAKDAREHSQSREICGESETPVLALHCRNQSQRSAGQESAINDLEAISDYRAFESAIKIVTPAIETLRTGISISVQLENKVRRFGGDA
jgi:hypothetical protein